MRIRYGNIGGMNFEEITGRVKTRLPCPFLVLDVCRFPTRLVYKVSSILKVNKIPSQRKVC